MKKSGKKTEAMTLRQKAEDLLKMTPAEKTTQQFGADTLKLIHQLQVHQIELELQNEELMRAKEQAEDAFHKYMELYDFAPSGYFTISKEGLIIELNLYGSQMLCKERSGLVNRRFSLFISDDTKSTFNRFLDLIFKSKVAESCEVTLIPNNDLPVYVHLNGIAEGNNDKCLITAIDITAQRKAEKENKQLLSQLITAQGKLSIALENGIGLWEWNVKSDEMILDESMERMFGLKPGTFGKTFTAFENLVNEEDLTHIKMAINGALEKDLSYETVFRTRSDNGNARYINSKALVNKDEDGMPVSLIGVCFDITSMKEGTERLILKLNEELLRSNKELESFAYVVSHDLQEPLRMVSSFTQLLSQKYKDKLDTNAQEYIRFAVDGSKRMYELLNGLLAYSRIHTKGKVFAQVNIDHVLESVTKNLSLIIKERGAIIKVDKLPLIFADESQMIQLFQNLIANSIKFSTGTPEIFISSKSEKGYYIISVRDKGMGIEPQYFARIFEIFQRLLPKEQYEGTGIGLAICKRIVERHGGRIWVESESGEGSTFFFNPQK